MTVAAILALPLRAAVPLGVCTLAGVVTLVLAVGNLARAGRGGADRARRLNVVVGSLGALCLFLFIAAPLATPPTYREIFRQFDIALPRLTELLLDVSYLVVGHWWLFGPVVMTLAAGMLLLPLLSPRRWCGAVSALLSLLSSLACLLVALSLALPFARLISSIRAGGN